MREYRFLIKEEDSNNGSQITVKNKDLIHQVVNVLRIEPGIKNPKEAICFIDNSGKIYDVDYVSASKKELSFEIKSTKDSFRELKTKIKFFVPVIKSENFLFMIRKLSELGVQDFYPVCFERSQKQNIQSLSKENNIRRAEKIIEEATEQCEGAILAKLHAMISFDEIQNHIAFNDIKIFASERLADEENADFLSQRLDVIKKVNTELDDHSSVCLLVGPEGGVADKEVDALSTWGFLPYSLGYRLLKAETAAISIISSLNLFN